MSIIGIMALLLQTASASIITHTWAHTHIYAMVFAYRLQARREWARDKDSRIFEHTDEHILPKARTCTGCVYSSSQNLRSSCQSNVYMRYYIEITLSIFWYVIRFWIFARFYVISILALLPRAWFIWIALFFAVDTFFIDSITSLISKFRNLIGIVDFDNVSTLWKLKSKLFELQLHSMFISWSR